VEVKSVLVGMLAGAAVCGSVWWLSARGERSHSQPATTSISPASSNSPRTLNTQVEDSASRAGPDSTEEHRADRNQQSTEEHVGGRDPSGTAEASNTPSSEASPPDTSTESRPAESTTDIAKARRQKEAKDLAWSYNTEQALRQFFASHQSSAKFDFTLVDCRTTFCEIEAVGSEEEQWPTWQQIMQDASKQPWSEFGPSGTSYGLKNGRPLYVATLYRREGADEKPH